MQEERVNKVAAQQQSDVNPVSVDPDCPVKLSCKGTPFNCCFIT